MALGSDELLQQTAPRLKAARPRLFVWAAAVALFVAFAGFAPSYYLKGLFGSPALPGLVHAHGFVMTLWFATLMAQVLLVSAGNVKTHRKLGLFGAVVAVLVLVVGTATAINAARNGVTPGPPPLVFLAIPLGDMVLFAVLVALGFAFRRRSDFHKRFMVCASLGIVTAAIARMPVPGGLPAFFAVTDAILLAIITADTYNNRRLHPAFAVGLALVVGSQVARFLIAGTPQWLEFARWLTS